jgi:uncharacterized protein (TIGR02147 family)
MPEIIDYSDYRSFLRDYYAEMKASHPHFSYERFAEKAGLSSKGFLYNVIRGAKDLPAEKILGVARAMKLDKKRSGYFETLVLLNQATDQDRKIFLTERLMAIKGTGAPQWKAHVLRRDQFEFYSQVCHSAVRSLIGIHGFDGDFARLAKAVNPPISVVQARRSVALLGRLGLIKRDSRGAYHLSNPHIRPERDVRHVALAQFHREALRMASDALVRLSPQERNISGITLGMSRKSYEAICDAIDEFRAKLATIVSKDTDADRVYQVCIQLFPISNTAAGRGEADAHR